jgi:hypothetical protein
MAPNSQCIQISELETLKTQQRSKIEEYTALMMQVLQGVVPPPMDQFQAFEQELHNQIIDLTNQIVNLQQQ